MFYSAFDIRLQHDRSCEAVSVMEKASVFLPSLVTDSPLPVTSPLPNSRSAPLFTRSFHRYSTAGGAALELCFKNWKANEIQACQAVQLQKNTRVLLCHSLVSLGTPSTVPPSHRAHLSDTHRGRVTKACDSALAMHPPQTSHHVVM